MQAEECIKGRRSVRKYTDREITKEQLHEIVSLARFSPSWKNSQVIRYHAVKNPEMKERLAQNCMMGFEYNAKTVLRCNTLVVVTAVAAFAGMKATGAFPLPNKTAGKCLTPELPAKRFALPHTARESEA